MKTMRLFFFFLVLLISCTNDPKLVQEFVSDKQQAIEQIKGAELLHTENGKVKIRILASSIERFQGVQPALIFSDHLEVYFYNDSSQLQSTLKADNASIDEEKKIMIMSLGIIFKRVYINLNDFFLITYIFKNKVFFQINFINRCNLI